MGRSGMSGFFIPRFRSSFTPLVPSVAGILSSCPSSDEIRSLVTELDVIWDPSINYLPGEGPYRCVAGSTDSNSELALINTLRCLKAINFDTPVPLFNETNMYRWLIAHRGSFPFASGGWKSDSVRSIFPIQVFNGGSSGASPSGSLVAGQPGSYISHRFLSGEHMRTWMTVTPSGPRRGIAGPFVVIMHEAWHNITGKRHDARDSVGEWTMDSSIAYGGAWAASYYLHTWLAEHSGSWLSAEDKQIMRQDAAGDFRMASGRW